MRITGQLPQPPRPMGRPETVPASEQGVGRAGGKPEKKGPMGPPETVPVRRGKEQADTKRTAEGQARQGGASDVALVKRNHGRINKWLSEFDQLASDIQGGQEVPVNKVEKALHLTQKLAEFLEDKSKLPDERTQELIGRLKGFGEVFTNYLEQQSGQSETAAAAPTVEPPPAEPVVEKLPTEGVVV